MDTPGEQEVLCLIKQQELHLLALPCIAGLADVEKHPSGTVQWRNAAQLRRAIAMYFYAYSLLPPGGMIYKPIGYRDQWFTDLCMEQPEMIADVYVRYVSVAWKSGSQMVAWFQTVTLDNGFEDIARLITIPLLQKLSVRSKYIHSLRFLLYAALRIHSPDRLRGIIQAKLAAKSMTVKQRVYWLAAGLFVAPEFYAEDTAAYVRGDQYRTHILVGAIDSFPRNGIVQPSNAALELMVKLIGPSCSPGPSGESSTYVHRKAQALVSSALWTLAVWPTEEVCNTLAALSNEPSLASWRPEILAATSHQRETLRATTFQTGTVEKVEAVLSNGPPTSPGDLTALTVDVLRSLANSIRNGNTSDWRQYWNVDSHGRARSPKPEGSCRDALSSDLEARMRSWGVSVHTESRHADDNRSDTLVCYNGWRVPLEAKRSCAEDLWSAIQDQLIAKYCIDPDSGGLGIYVVFWFGNRPDCRPKSIDGVQPGSAAKLETLLTETLTAPNRQKIAVVVVDVANPQR